MKNFQKLREVIINMIEKKVKYEDKDFLKHLKGLGLSKEDIGNILGKTKRKKFEDGGGGDGGGDGGSSGGDGDSSGDSSGDSGPGGSDDGSSSGVGSGEGDSTGDAGDQGGTEGPGPGVGAEGGFGIGPDAAAEAAQSVTADDVSAQAQADAEDAATAAAAQAAQSQTGIMSTIGNLARAAFNAYATFSPTGIAMNAISNAISNAQRGVTAPNDFSQATESVQSGPAQSPSGGDGGISNLVPEKYQLYYETTPQNLDEFTRRIRLNLGLPI